MSVVAIVGLVVLGAALIVLLISLLHPEGRRRPGGYLDGREPKPCDDATKRHHGTSGERVDHERAAGDGEQGHPSEQ